MAHKVVSSKSSENSHLPKANACFWNKEANLKAWTDATTHFAWRHTIGRVSCLARIPIYALGILLQTAKTVIKGIISPVASFIAWAADTDKLDSWTFSGVGKDAIMTGHLTDRMFSSAIGVFFAPPKQYHSCWKALKDTVKTVALGSHHQIQTVEELYFLKITCRAQYHKLIIGCDQIGSRELYLYDNQVKAGDVTFNTFTYANKIKAG